MKVVAQPTHYGRIAKTLHWLIATLILLDFGTAISFGYFNPGDLFYFTSAYPAHMTIGMLVLALSVLCVIWRLMHQYPPLPADMAAWSRVLAKTAHVCLYGFIVIVPVTGWAVLSVRRRPAVLYGALDWSNIGYLSDLSRPLRARLHELFLPTHAWLSYIGMALVTVHIIAAGYHHFIRQDDVLRRMLPGMKAPARRSRPHGAG